MHDYIRAKLERQVSYKRNRRDMQDRRIDEVPVNDILIWSHFQGKLRSENSDSEVQVRGAGFGFGCWQLIPLWPPSPSPLNPKIWSDAPHTRQVQQYKTESSSMSLPPHKVPPSLLLLCRKLETPQLSCKSHSHPLPFHHLFKSSVSPLMSSSFTSCFRPFHTSDDPPPLSPPNPNLTTYLYHTHLGFVSITWSRSVLGPALHLQLHLHSSSSSSSPSSASASFRLHIKPFLFCKKHGVKKISPNTRIFWNVSKARFGAGPEPLSGFYVAVVVDKSMALLVGDGVKDAYSKTRAREPLTPQILVLKREHVVVNKVYSTKAKFGGRMREIQIDCGSGDDSGLCWSVDGKKVLQIKRLKWKFRGNEKVEVDGVPIQISWDVYNWLFERESGDGHATFMFKFEETEDEEARGKELTNLWTQQQNWSGSNELGKSFSSSPVSISSSARSLGGSSSVLEWSSVEENELVVPVGFSLLIYAWKS